MAGISVSGLISNSFDWKSIVDQLITIDSAPVARLQTEESSNIDRLAVFSTIKTKLTTLQTSSQALSAPGLFNGRTASSSTSGSGWSATAADGSDTGNFTISVTQLATAARLNGKSGIAGALNAGASDILSDPNGIADLTLATLPTSTPLTAGTFTINGQQVVVDAADSLQGIFDKIAALNGDVTASYNGTTDKISLSSSSEIVLGAVNDTSNFLSVMRLANNGGSTISSGTALGATATKVPLADARLRGPIGTVDGDFTINGVSIAYNTATDSLSTILSRITASTAGVTATYDSASDRVVLTNNATGDTGVGAADGTGTLLAALGITTGSSLQHGRNAQFSINGGATQSSASNTLDESVHGIAGVAVTVNTETTQTVNVAPDTASMKTAIQGFITNFNAVQSYIDSQTQITKGPDGKVTAALLSDNREVQNWASQLRSLAFGQISGVTGSVQRLAALGIDFNSTDSTLSIKDSTALDNALTTKSADVGAFFNTATTGFASQFTTYLAPKLADTTGELALQMGTLNKQNTGIDAQITTLNLRLVDERERLTTAFLAMQNAQSQAQQQQQTLTNMFSSSNNNSCWVARAVYGASNPRWLLFRFWLLYCAPGWFRALYLRHGEGFAAWIDDKPRLRSTIRRWMDARIASLPSVIAGV